MKQWFRFSIDDVFVGVLFAAVFVITNLVQRDIGSGLQILLQGWPFPAATSHSLNGITIHWIGILANIVTGGALVGFATMIVGKTRRLLTRKTDIQTNREIVG